MAEIAAAVTDTHPLLFHAAGGGRLGRKAAEYFAACERRQALLYVPAVVIWECALLTRAGRVNLRQSVRGFFEDLFSNPAYQPYDLTAEQVLMGEEMRVNRDPFDALICAAARDLELPLISRDGDIRSSGAVRIIW
ncbi:MAG: type II toxin-antitoxin system VapC family toxin [Acidobacteriota bacterium]|nr:type II toxin-antitoxin system VapC family toxin [Acidobacteriota bacterium]